jgi:hypothetical protein
MTMPVVRTLRLTAEQRERLERHLFPGDDCESVALGLCGARLGEFGHIYFVHEIVMIPDEQCLLRTPIAVRWDVHWLVPLLEKAAKRGMWVIKFHSHPNGFVRFSEQDDITDKALASSVAAILDDHPRLLSAFMSPGGDIHARVVDAANTFHSVNRVVVVGDSISSTPISVEVKPDDADLRTRQAFGDGTVALLRSLSVGVAGCSGTGSWIVEMLARLGVGRLVLVDPDVIERKNLNRIVNSKQSDAQGRRPKVEVLSESIKAIGLGTEVQCYKNDLANAEVVKALAGCDVLFGCLDSADGRDLLNRIATYYTLPYIDVGVRLDADGKGGVEQVCCAVHYLLPGGSSLLSRGVITSEQVQAQALYRTNPQQHAALEKEGYIKGVFVDRPAVVSVNGFAATHAVNEMLARLHPFRRDSGDEFRYQLFSLSDGAWLRLSDGPACVLMGKFVGRGDCLPLLGNPSLS